MNRFFLLLVVAVIAAVAPALRVSAVVVTGKATPADQLKVPPGFKIELLRSADGEKEGSWVSMAVDEKGRLYLSPQYILKGDWGGLARVTLNAEGKIEKWEPINLPIGGAMGMLWAYNSLYVSGVGPEGQAIYRLKDTNGDDILDNIKVFKAVPGGAGEHGAHAMVVGPDNKLYIAHGNSTGLIDGIAPDSPHQHYAEDHLLPRIKDPVATFFDTLKVPYGYVVRTDENGEKWELFAGGFRNEYDIDFNTDGELFTFDSDMEWDVGLPWYRPTRILHITSGAEYGFREGNTKWPAYYEDSVPAEVDVGTSSPTGVKFGTKSNFPAQYRSALFAFDWTYGRILAVHMKPKGATYTAHNDLPNAYLPLAPAASKDVEEFMTGRGMPVTDLEFGKDGAMYFTVGGRGTQAGLYRISYVGPAASDQPVSVDKTAAEAREKRRELEAFHGKAHPKAVDAAWPYLSSEDRSLRYAARIAIEFQPVEQWQDRALSEKDPRAGLTALIALARLGEKSSQEPLLKALAKFPLDGLSPELRLEKYRVIELAFIRHGRPLDEMAQMGASKLSKQYPAKTYAENHELSQLLIFLGDSDAVEKTLKLLQSSEDPAEQIWFANVLSEAKGPWTQPQREAYFDWFNRAATFKGGNSAPKFVLKMRDTALEKLTPAEQQALSPILNKKPVTPVRQPTQPAVARKFVKTWTVEDLDAELPKASTGRNFARGKEIFYSLQCATCHRFGNEGGGVGPDITAVGGRFNRHDLLVSIIEPSKAISEQYASYVITTRDGKRRQGQIGSETNDIMMLITDPLLGTKERIPQSHITAKKMASVSTMPTNLIDVLSKDEIFDLLAYIETGGNAKAPNFK